MSQTDNCDIDCWTAWFECGSRGRVVGLNADEVEEAKEEEMVEVIKVSLLPVTLEV